jgi:hypothetical protein
MKEYLGFLGGLVLLFSWLSQTFLFDRWKSRLTQIQEAYLRFITYQSNHGIYIVLAKLVSPEEQKEVLALEIRDFRTGLNHLREVLSEKQRQDLEDKIESQAGTYTTESIMYPKKWTTE